MQNDIHVAFASDGNYFYYVYIAILTLYENNKSVNNLYVHYIEQDVEQNELNKLKKLAEKYNRNIDIRPLEMPTEYIEILPAFGEKSKTTYAKFWFSTIFKDAERILYLDPDVLVLGNIVELYNTEMNEEYIAGVLENLPEYHREASKMSRSGKYINGGMVLCNLSKWREHDLERRFMDRLSDTSVNLNYDQGILNEVCKNQIKVVHCKYNTLAELFEFKNANKIKRRYGFDDYYSQNEVSEAISKPAIIHFTGFLYGKPLSKKCTHPYAEYFWEKAKEAELDIPYSNKDIAFGKKVRKFFLHHLPFSFYLGLETILDIHRKNVIIKSDNE